MQGLDILYWYGGSWEQPWTFQPSLGAARRSVKHGPRYQYLPPAANMKRRLKAAGISDFAYLQQQQHLAGRIRPTSSASNRSTTNAHLNHPHTTHYDDLWDAHKNFAGTTKGSTNRDDRGSRSSSSGRELTPRDRAEAWHLQRNQAKQKTYLDLDDRRAFPGTNDDHWRTQGHEYSRAHYSEAFNNGTSTWRSSTSTATTASPTKVRNSTLISTGRRASSGPNTPSGPSIWALKSPKSKDPEQERMEALARLMHEQTKPAKKDGTDGGAAKAATAAAAPAASQGNKTVATKGLAQATTIATVLPAWSPDVSTEFTGKPSPRSLAPPADEDKAKARSVSPLLPEAPARPPPLEIGTQQQRRDTKRSEGDDIPPKRSMASGTTDAATTQGQRPSAPAAAATNRSASDANLGPRRSGADAATRRRDHAEDEDRRDEDREEEEYRVRQPDLRKLPPRPDFRQMLATDGIEESTSEPLVPQQPQQHAKAASTQQSTDASKQPSSAMPPPPPFHLQHRLPNQPSDPFVMHASGPHATAVAPHYMVYQPAPYPSYPYAPPPPPPGYGTFVMPTHHLQQQHQQPVGFAPPPMQHPFAAMPGTPLYAQMAPPASQWGTAHPIPYSISSPLAHGDHSMLNGSSSAFDSAVVAGVPQRTEFRPPRLRPHSSSVASPTKSDDFEVRRPHAATANDDAALVDDNDEDEAAAFVRHARELNRNIEWFRAHDDRSPERNKQKATLHQPRDDDVADSVLLQSKTFTTTSGAAGRSTAPATPPQQQQQPQRAQPYRQGGVALNYDGGTDSDDGAMTSTQARGKGTAGGWEATQPRGKDQREVPVFAAPPRW